jgi:voltage-gated sodium channel
MKNLDQLQEIFFKIRSNKIFELFVIGLIVLSALLIGVKTYDIPQEAISILTFLDWVITCIFLSELVIRFLGENNKLQFFKDPWNVFDTLIVSISMIPIEDSEMAIIGRLIRIFRVLRMVSIIPELRTLMDALVKAVPQLFYILVMMFILFYIYAAVGTTLFSTINQALWGDIAVSLLTLFRVMTFEDWTDVMYETMEVYPLSWIYYLTFIFLTTFALLNMVIGVIVNVLDEEHQRIAKKKLKEAGEPTLMDLQSQLNEIKHLLRIRDRG